MSPETIFHPLLGGAIIGLAASLLLVANGRVAGISSILGGAIAAKTEDRSWRLAFLGGLVVGGISLALFLPGSLEPNPPFAMWRLVLAGLLVGFGTQLGSGCTSGHGVCGIARLSPRSLVATMTFMATGFATVAILRALGVLS